MVKKNASFQVFSGEKSTHLAEQICKILGCELGKITFEHFSDGEFACYFNESIRGENVYLVQSTCPSADNLMELLLMIDAAKRASANQIIAVIPYFGWARQDRKDKPRVCIGSKLIADMLQVAGANRILTIDLHADQIQGFFNIPVDHLFGCNIFIPYIQSLKLENLIIASPDVGGSKRADKFASALHVPMVVCYKKRVEANKVASMYVLGDVSGKDVVIVDDIVDTAGTLCKAADMMKQLGARSVRAVISHGIMSGNACDKVMGSQLDALYFSDSLPFDTTRCPKVKQISLADAFARAIQSIEFHGSLSAALIDAK